VLGERHFDDVCDDGPGPDARLGDDVCDARAPSRRFCAVGGDEPGLWRHGGVDDDARDYSPWRFGDALGDECA
jgi:hypothetical protein